MILQPAIQPPVIIRDNVGRPIATVQRDLLRPGGQIVRDTKGRLIARVETRGNQVVITTTRPLDRRVYTVIGGRKK